MSGLRLDVAERPSVTGFTASARTEVSGAASMLGSNAAIQGPISSLTAHLRSHAYNRSVKSGAVVCLVNAREQPLGSGTFMCGEIVPITYGPDPRQGGAVIGWLSIDTHTLKGRAVVHHFHVQQTRLAQTPTELLEVLSAALSSKHFGRPQSVILRLLRWNNRSVYPEALIIPSNSQGHVLIGHWYMRLSGQYCSDFDGIRLLRRWVDTPIGKRLLYDTWHVGVAVEVIPVSTYCLPTDIAEDMYKKGQQNCDVPRVELGTLGVEPNFACSGSSSQSPYVTSLIFTKAPSIPINLVPTFYCHTPPSGVDPLTGDFNGAF